MGLFDPSDPDIEKAVHMAVRYLAVRSRSEKEMKTHLKKKWDENIISTVIERLKQWRYLDDEAFARLFIENRKRQNPKSKFAITYELKQKGICNTILENLLKDYDDALMARKALRARHRQWHHLDPDVRRQKAMNYLRYRGFGYEACMSAWEDFQNDIGFDAKS
jgi:regulatory protein